MSPSESGRRHEYCILHMYMSFVFEYCSIRSSVTVRIADIIKEA